MCLAGLARGSRFGWRSLGRALLADIVALDVLPGRAGRTRGEERGMVRAHG
jgi:hypothetical protein